MVKKPSKNKGTNPIVAKDSKKAKDPISYDSMNFSWRVHNSFIDYRHPKFGWCTVDILYFLKNIIQRLQSYEGQVWHDLKLDHRCHPWGLDEIPKECYSRLEERQIDIEQLYQIPLGSKPRIIGYKDRQVFYLMWWDKEHEFCPTKAK